MRTRGSLLLSDADQVCGRADDHVLPMPGMCASVERKLGCNVTFCPRLGLTIPSWTALLTAYAIIFTTCAYASADSWPAFSIVAYICVWKRPLLTEFVVSHYDHLRESLVSEGIRLDIFIVGSENSSTTALAQRFSAPYAVHPNSPLGAKHNKGLKSLWVHFKNEVKLKGLTKLPDAVGVFGSDDIVNRAFFVSVRDLMVPTKAGRNHMVGLRDIFFYDLKSGQLVYTKGYRSFESSISGTLGCGRVYSWSLLDVMDWKLWDMEREHGLDQSATRNVMRKVAMIEEVSTALVGREKGIIAVDIKSDGYRTGSNIWKFDEVVEAVGRNGRFHDFDYEEDEGVLQDAFGQSISDRFNALRVQMSQN